MSKGEHEGILHNWAVYRCAQVVYGIAIVERKGLKEGVNGSKSDNPHWLVILSFSVIDPN